MGRLDLPDVRRDEDEFQIRDSGARKQFESGMVRDVTDDKIDYTLALDGPMFKRLAIHLTKGAKKYAKRNWMKARGQEELDRFKESATRHFFQWLNGDTDEDHAAATIFNINGAEYVKGQMIEPGTVVRYAPGFALPITDQYLRDHDAA